MSEVEPLFKQILDDCESAGRISPYPADANEPDPRYKSFGVRADGRKAIWSSHKKAVRALPKADQFKLATTLIETEIGECQHLGLLVLEPHAAEFTPDRFGEIDRLMRFIHGWSKVDSFCGSLLRDILYHYPAEFLPLVRTWNTDPDMWMRRFSVVLFTRKVAKSGRFTDVALEMCHNLRFDPEDLVLKGVGWSLKDLMKADKERLLQVVAEMRREGVSSTVTLYAIRDLKGEARQRFLNQA